MSERPTYCPKCGTALPEGENYAMPCYDEVSGDGVFDTYCPSCGWSGDISPDSLQGAYPTGPTGRSDISR